MKKIEKLIKGLTILSEYSNAVECDNRTIIAGPYEFDKVSEEHAKELEKMEWDFEFGQGWEFLI